MNGNGNMNVYVLFDIDASPVVLTRDPISVTCCVLDNEILLLDPTDLEEEVCSGRVTIAVDEKSDICYLNEVIFRKFESILCCSW